MLPTDPIPADGFKLTQGRTPRTKDKPLMVQFRNSYVDRRHTYTASQIRWSETGSDWDVVAVRLA